MKCPTCLHDDHAQGCRQVVEHIHYVCADRPGCIHPDNVCRRSHTESCGCES